MSSAGEKTEEPTEKKLKDARKKGDVPDRKNVIEGLFMCFSLVSLFGLIPLIFKKLMVFSKDIYQQIESAQELNLLQPLDDAVSIAIVILVFLMANVAFTLIVGLALNKFNFAPAALVPKFEKFNPVNGVKNIFSMRTIANFIRLIVIFSTLVLFTYYLIITNLSEALAGFACGTACLLQVFLRMLAHIAIFVCILQIAFSAIDIKIQNALFKKQNKMSKDDVKQENKQSYGDDKIKNARKSRAKEDASLPLIQDATHVVYSNKVLVALIYYPGTEKRPYLLFKIRGKSVGKFRQVLRSKGKRLFNLPAVAQDFYRMGTVGQYLPLSTVRSFAKVVEAEDSQSAA
ncbi:EscU/YscU/HrcU family type III secretion system export apparatus switch protein [uncultured Tateyamaria sp.]|uniref:EscU/YscU/HrcU family type III secretion system export apparatus switch protein n=1 Tax=uncultured Tateyamaria sp. TaxID=455651 RepID=UPI002607FE0E|nr:EscU/YscU/HrcU family type III secretion system export apparatus switch protein [uncultured Tateyamaria sp.]